MQDLDLTDDANAPPPEVEHLGPYASEASGSYINVLVPYVPNRGSHHPLETPKWHTKNLKKIGNL